MSETQLDLRKLTLDRPSTNGSPMASRHRRWVSRYLVPGSILFGFVVLLTVAAGHQLFPKTPVTVVPTIVKRGVVQPGGTPMFQAAGWIEPSPTKVSVPALAPGVVEALLVVEGQQVNRGEPIARLIAIDAEIAVEQCRATLALREGELQRANAELSAAENRVEHPLHLKSQLAEAQSLLARAVTERQRLPFLIKAADANVSFRLKSLDGKQGASGAVAGIIVLQAERDLAAAEAELEELHTRGPNLDQEIAALNEKVNILKEQLNLLIEERGQVEEAKAKVVAACASRDEAKLQLRLAELAVERTLIRAPMDGRILRLIASPGIRVMGLEQSAGQSASTVVEMYDPKRVQVRADVRLEDVPMVAPGAPVEIQTASSNKPIRGRVLQPTSSANIQKNTLEVKVELIDPPPTIRPEMLVTATFLAPTRDLEKNTIEQVEQTFIPEQLVITTESGSTIWVVDENDQAMPRTVILGSVRQDGLVEITSGLNGTDKLIASGTQNLRPGQRVIIRGEDPAIGAER